MAYYADLSPCDYFGRWQEVLIAVGWLEPDHSFATGKVSKEFFAQLTGLLRDPWQPVVTAGYHRCAFCQFTGRPSKIHFEDNSIVVGTANLFIPATACVHVAPSLVAHYVDAHEYCPPADFQEAVLKCPQMRSIAYLKEIKARGLNLGELPDDLCSADNTSVLMQPFLTANIPYNPPRTSLVLIWLLRSSSHYRRTLAM